LERLDLWELRNEYAGDLSGGQRKLLELGRALMAEPDLLLLDEPMAGVNPNLTDRLLAQIRELRDEQELSFLIVEHDIDLIMSISDKIVAMHNGKVLSKGSPETVQENEELLEAYLGADTV
jgi:branched-chain amino acid transport system ATP-binding protein